MDRFLDYSLKSLAWHIKNNVSSLTGAWVITPNFDFDRAPDPSDINNTIPRELPFATIQLVKDEVRAFSIGNILYDHTIEVDLGVFASNATELFQLTGDMKQVLRTATHPETGHIGIPLLHIASGLAFPYQGHIKLDVDEYSQGFSPGVSEPGSVVESVEEPGNRKFFTVTRAVLTAIKDKNSVLLENLGNINIDNDSL